MEKYMARISKNGAVDWIIVCDNPEFCKKLGGTWRQVPIGLAVSIGWVWDGEKYIAPVYEEVEDDN